MYSVALPCSARSCKSFRLPQIDWFNVYSYVSVYNPLFLLLIVL